jgi:alanine-glyoxylate transaminase/serine-glyoxylate transaminase/serine-pyruvate transaminase
MTTGPVEVSPRVQAAQLDAFSTPHCADFWSLHDEVLALTRQVLRTEDTVAIFPGSIRNALDCSLGSIVEPGSKVLAIENGYWGRLVGEMCVFFGAEVEWLSFDYRQPFDPERVAEALARHPDIRIVTMMHVETSTGAINPVELVGPMVRRHGALFFVDTACSAGIHLVDTDAWCIDIGVTGSQKGFCSVAGLGVVSISQRALAQARSVAAKVMRSSFNLGSICDRTVQRARPPSFTQPPTLFHALRAALDEILEDGLDRWFSYHEETARQFRERLAAAGLSLVTSDRDRPGNSAVENSNGVVGIRYPEGVDDEAFRRHLAEEQGILVLGNVGDLTGSSFRVGLMSPPQIEPRSISGLLDAIPQAFRQARLTKN